MSVSYSTSTFLTNSLWFSFNLSETKACGIGYIRLSGYRGSRVRGLQGRSQPAEDATAREFFKGCRSLQAGTQRRGVLLRTAGKCKLDHGAAGPRFDFFIAQPPTYPWSSLCRYRWCLNTFRYSFCIMLYMLTFNSQLKLFKFGTLKCNWSNIKLQKNQLVLVQ